MLNTCAIMGRLTKTPELRTTPNQKTVTSFTLAVQNRNDSTDFIDVVAWGKTAEFVCKYFDKGSSLVVVGRLQTRNWEDKQGNKRKAVEVLALEVHFAGRSDRRGETPQNETGGIEDMADDELPF